MKRIQSKTATVGLRHQEADTPAATTVDNKDVKTFEVLYNKRTNKVHKNKGVSKMDGKLIVYPPPSCLVTLVNASQQDESASDDDQDNHNKKKRSWKKSSSTNGPIYSGINTKVSKQVFGDASSPLQIDDIITLPAYEVQITAVILNHHDDGGNTPAAGNATLKTAPILKSTTMLQRRPLKPLLQSKRAGLAVKKSATSNWQQRRQPPVQPKRGPSTLDSDSDDDMDTAPTTTKSAPARLLSTTRPNPLLNRKRKVLTASVSSATNNKVARPTATATTNATSFPGAIGSCVIPPSIRKILRPHQQTGIAFLFNCLTGASQELQQAAAETAVGSDYRGCILADEMGLGKTLMTIATTHALYRRTKSHVSLSPPLLVFCCFENQSPALFLTTPFFFTAVYTQL